MVALSIPMVLSIVIFAHKVDGNSVSGICMRVLGDITWGQGKDCCLRKLLE